MEFFTTTSTRNVLECATAADEAITSRYPSSEPSVYPTVPTSERRTRKKC